MNGYCCDACGECIRVPMEWQQMLIARGKPAERIARRTCQGCYEALAPLMAANECVCGRPAAKRAQDRPGWICDACALRVKEEDFERLREAFRRVTEPLHERGRDDAVHTYTDAAEIYRARIEKLKADAQRIYATTPMINGEGDERLPVSVEEMRALIEPLTGVTSVMRGGFGITVRGEDINAPGLKHLYPDATPAAKPESELVLSVDDGRWDE